MAQVNKPYGKDNPDRFISGALTGGSGKSNEMVDYSVDRPEQKIKTVFALDNVGKVYGRDPTSMKDMSGWPGSDANLKHSLTGASAVNEEVGAAGSVKHVIIPNH